MKIITNTFILESSNETAVLIANLKKRGVALENFVEGNNQVCLKTANTPLFATLTETTNDNETKLMYSLYYQKELLATTTSLNETCSTQVNRLAQLPSLFSSAPIPLMKAKDYDHLLQRYENTSWDRGQEITTLELEQSLISPANISAFNEHITAVFKSCLSILNKKDNKTSFSGFATQFRGSERILIKQSQFLLEYLAWFTDENKNIAKAISLEFLRTITDGYSFIPSQPFHGFFTKSSEKKAYIDNFISYVRLIFDRRSQSAEWHTGEQNRFNRLIDFAILNDIDKQMDNEQKKYFLETIYLINQYYDLPAKTLMLFNPDNIIDRSIFNEILEDSIGGKKDIPDFGLFSQIKDFNETQLAHLKKMLSYDKIKLFNQWGILGKPEVNENTSPDFLFSEKLVTRVNLRKYLPTRTDIDWEQWLKKAFAPHADIKLFMMEIVWSDIVQFVVVLEHKKPLYNSSDSHIYFNMDGGGLCLDHPQIHFSVRGPNRNGSEYGYYLSPQSSVLEFRVDDIQCLEKDFDKKWQEISLALAQMVTKIFEQGIDYKPNYKPCISWKNDKSDLLKQMQSLAKWWNIDYKADEEYFKGSTLKEPTLNVVTSNSNGLFAPPPAVESKTSVNTCPGCNVM